MKITETRTSDTTVAISNGSGFEITLFANKDVEIDRQSVQESENIFGIWQTIDDLNGVGFFGDEEAEFQKALFTPDFHKGAGIPIGSVMQTKGFVIPKSAGTDIGCGMRFVVTSMTKGEFQYLGKQIDEELRYLFFQGGRDVAMSPQTREAVLRYGLPGLSKEGEGLLAAIDHDQLEKDTAKIHRNGSWKTNDLWNFTDYVKGSGGLSRDDMMGSIGGGNHFVEIQYVEDCIDRQTAYHWGIKRGHVVIMAHTGSVDFGTSIGKFFMEAAKNLFPKALKKPEHGFFPLPVTGPNAKAGAQYLSAMGLAANFAIVNRMVLTELVLKALTNVAKREITGHLVYDAPHNLVWADDDAPGSFIHRKGATPAEYSCDEVFPDGHPVIIPGSMGDASFILKGCGNRASLCSAPHGAGRIVARGEARQNKFDEIDKIRVVSKIDPSKVRRDIADEFKKTLLEEAPSNYKKVLPAIETVDSADIAKPVAKLLPLLTIKA